MAKQQIIDQVTENLKKIKALPFDEFKQDPGEPYQPWSGLSIEDFYDSYERMLNELDATSDPTVLELLPLNAIQNILNSTSNVIQHCGAFFKTKNQQTFQAAFPQIEALRTNFLSFGIRYLSHMGKDIEEKSNLLDQELLKFSKSNSEIEALKRNVSELIAPGVAGSLSQSFSNRQHSLNIKQKMWVITWIISIFISIGATIWIIDPLVNYPSGVKTPPSMLIILFAVKNSADVSLP